MSFRKDQYVACKYNGDNGDLIVGRIEIVRNGGKIVIENLLTGKSAVKSAAVLARRDKIVSKRDALGIKKVFETSGKRAARQAAVATRALHEQVWSADSPTPDLPEVAVNNPMNVEDLISILKALPTETFKYVARKVWGDILAAFGVQ